MPSTSAFFILFVSVLLIGPVLARFRAKSFARNGVKMAARPVAHGQFTSASVIAGGGIGLVLGFILVAYAGLSLSPLTLAIFGGITGAGIGIFKATPSYRARAGFEALLIALFWLCAALAVLTTLLIFSSMILETRSFFGLYPLKDFLFGTTWSPDFRGNSALGLLPLLWGTLYISLVALLVAVPIGLMSAIFLAEYANNRTRTFAKPLIEVLAGIPTIVYGLFALMIVGPALRDYLAQPLGLGDSASSVATAGLVMGIMLIPFVSSLSDDILRAVPASLRDGALGLGATKAETVRQVVLPAALPGLVGSILLAASRAIGETMIVVLGAGAAAAQMGQGLGTLVNPFQAMTTVTVKIVSQLTGDSDFAAPETLVAFALGLSLFLITLGLNVIALKVVRRYREAYQ